MFSVGRGKNSRSARRRKDRVRRSDSLDGLSPDDMFSTDFVAVKQRITFRTGERPICLGETIPDVYNDCNKYNAISANAGEGGDWIEILVHHNRRYQKSDILKALFLVVDDHPFFPVAYSENGKKTDFDSFLVRNCKRAIDNLFERHLKLQMEDGNSIKVTVKFNVAASETGQISVNKKVLKLLMKKFTRLIAFESATKVLDLQNFEKDPEFEDIIVNLGNKAALEVLCTTISTTPAISSGIDGLNLANNKIKTLAPLDALVKSKLQVLDLRSNEIDAIASFKHLKNISISELLIVGNPIVQHCYNYTHQLNDILPLLNKIDGQLTWKKKSAISMTQTTDEDSQMYSDMLDGDVIKSNDINENLNIGKYRQSKKWHQVTVHHDGKCTKADIITSLFTIVSNVEFFPIYYKAAPTQDTFFVRECFEAIEILIQNMLLIKLPKSHSDIPLSLKMNVANFKPGQVEPGEKIVAALNGKFNIIDGELNLENFAANEEFSEVVISFMNAKALAQVLSLSSKQYSINITKIKLNDNSIVSSRGMHPLIWMKGLKEVDLRTNEIENLKEFIAGFPKNLKLKTIWLSNNPFCKYVTGPMEYITAVKQIIPNLIFLDGEAIQMNGIIPKQNFLCSLECYDFVESFIIQFYRIYDSNQRLNLKEMYHTKAIFSMSSNYEHSIITTINSSRINRYISTSRNILKMSNFRQSDVNVFVGPDKITRLFCILPPTEHDFHSFLIDVTYYTPELICLTIRGLFKEPGATLLDNDLWFGFSRTLILTPYLKGLGLFERSVELKISNDLVCIYNLTNNQAKNAFKVASTVLKDVKPDLTSDAKEQMIVVLQDLTNLKPHWCTRCLEESNWNFTKSLELFFKLHEENKIPLNGFL